MTSSPIAVTDSQFSSEVLQCDIPVIVDYWAEWCGPCKALGPIFESLAPEFDGRVKFVKVNVDQNPETPAQFGVRGIPTLMIFKGGDVVGTKVGTLTKTDLTNFINDNL